MNPPEVTDGNADGKVDLAWDFTNIKDFKEAKIEWKLTNSDDDYESTTISKLYNSTSLNLEGGNEYDFNVRYCDYAGNEKIWEFSMITRPNTPSALTVNALNNTTATPFAYGDTNVRLTVTKPEEGNFDGLRIRYFPHGTEEEDYWETVQVESSDEEIQNDITDLENGTIYDFEICSYDASSGKYSLPYKISSAYPNFTTLPTAATILDSNLHQNTL